MRRRFLLGGLVLAVAACGATPAAPVAGVTPPDAFQPFAQRVSATTNEIDFHWSGGNGSRFRIFIGTGPGASDAVTADVSERMFTFVAPRHAALYYARVAAIDGSTTTAPTPEVSVTAIDVRHVADALFFGAGPMSPLHVVRPGTTPFLMWPPGTHLRILVSPQAGERIRALAQDAIDDYASLVNGAVTGTAEITGDDMAQLTLAQLPPLTIAIRVSGACSAGAAGCTSAGPGPSATGAALITLATTTVTPVVVTHELGHALGFSHVVTTSSLVGLCMGPSGGSTKLSSAERAAITSAYAAGLRPGSTRDQALAAGVVLPYAGG